MSFTADVKQEISLRELSGNEERAALSALIQMTSSLLITHGGLALLIKTENGPVSRAIYRMVRERYQVEIIPSVKRRMNLKKNLIYELRLQGDVRSILEDLGIYSLQGLRDVPLRSIVRTDAYARAYLAGAFMAEGSVNSPATSNYHLEIKAANTRHAAFLCELMERFAIDARQVERRGRQVVYIKSAEKIADFLRAVEASENLMRFEDMRISRDMSNSIQRLNNVEIANELKSFNAAKNQLEDIAVLQKYGKLRDLDEKLKDIAELRLEDPEASLSELSEIYRLRTGNIVSKSGMKHRFVRIHELAQKVKNQYEPE
ncbi:MAG: DNA-binding protein WhiA [Solobacterium sp.]|nr:DNA-binding protein WhiA [Solobacterium sp.]